MNPHNLDRYRVRLDKLRTQMEATVANLTIDALQPAGGEQSGGISNAPLHMADLATHSQEQHLALGLLENERQVLHDIDAALQRIADPRALGERLAAIPGVVEHGLFIGLAHAAVIAGPEGRRIVERP